MKHAQSVPARRWPWICAPLCALVLAAGCASGTWLESPSEAELPLDPPARGYPTAIRASLSDDAESANAKVESPAQPAAAPPAPSDAKSATTASQTHPTPAERAEAQRLQRTQQMLAPLAVIPPQFVHPPATATLPPAATTAAAPAVVEPAPLPAPLTVPLANQWPPPSLLPGLESNVAAFTAPRASPVSAAASPIASAATPLGPADDSHAKAATDSAEKDESPADKQAKLDRARSELIEALEAQIRHHRSQSATDEELPRLEQQLRLVYLTAGRLDEAVAAVESLDAQQREAYKDLMFGLGVWLSPDEARRPPLRSAKVLHSLRDATGELAAASKLELRNLVFCERVDHFGWYGEFPRKEFQPKQQVILYTEVENFTAEHKGPAGYETELQGSYEILDSSGQIVASRQLQLDKEICRNYRRDYFLAYRIYMPDNIPPGRYRLELTVEDLKARGKYQGRKLGEGMIEFTIR